MTHPLSAPHILFMLVLSVLTSRVAAASPADGLQSGLQGVWQTDGYGYLVEIGAGGVTLYETTATSCLKSALDAGPLTPAKAEGVPARFTVSLPGFIAADMDVTPASRRGDEVETIGLHRTDTVTTMTAHRLAALPALCAQKTPANWGTVVAIFRAAFRENYPFFTGPWGPWAADAPLPEGAADMQGFASLTHLLTPLHDAHTALVAPDLDQMYFGSENAPDSLTDDEKAARAALVDSHYLAATPKRYAGGQLSFGLMAGGTGYLRVDGFYGYSENDEAAKNRQILKAALDNIFAANTGMKALVIDLRANSGGSDRLALDLAGRLTDKRYAAYAKQAVQTGGARAAEIGWAAPHTLWVSPQDGPRYLGPVALLTGPDTMSAAETFTMALMGRTPTVLRVGAPTRGAFSDMLPRTLPNGWLFALPNERYVDAGGKSYDRTGIPPHVAVRAIMANTASAEGAAAHDPTLEAALKALGQGRQH